MQPENCTITERLCECDGKLGECKGHDLLREIARLKHEKDAIYQSAREEMSTILAELEKLKELLSSEPHGS